MMNSILKKITLIAIFLTFFAGISIDQNQNLDASNNFEIIGIIQAYLIDCSWMELLFLIQI